MQNPLARKYNTVLKNCWFYDAFNTAESNMQASTFHGCYMGGMTDFYIINVAATISTQFNLCAGNGAPFGLGGGSSMRSCLSYNGLYGAYGYGHVVSVDGCIFYQQTLASSFLSNVTSANMNFIFPSSK